RVPIRDEVPATARCTTLWGTTERQFEIAGEVMNKVRKFDPGTVARTRVLRRPVAPVRESRLRLLTSSAAAGGPSIHGPQQAAEPPRHQPSQGALESRSGKRQVHHHFRQRPPQKIGDCQVRYVTGD